MSKGYIKLHRSLLESRIFVDDDPYLFKIWVWCLLKASYKDRDVMVGNTPVHLKRGQFVTGRTKGAEECGCNRGKFKYCLDKLEKQQAVRQLPQQAFTIIEVVNFNKYQDFNEEGSAGCSAGSKTDFQPESDQRATQTKIAKEYINNSYSDARGRARAREGSDDGRLPFSIAMSFEDYCAWRDEVGEHKEAEAWGQ